MAGYGRGGRGAALFKLLEEPPRAPGAQARESETSAETGQQRSSPPQPGHVPTGRGQHLAQLYQQMQQAKPGEAGAAPQASPSRPAGRGLAALGAAGAAPFGRGIAALGQQPVSRPGATPSPPRLSDSPPQESQVQKVTPHHGQGDDQTAGVTQQMGKMTVGANGHISPPGRNGHVSPQSPQEGKKSPTYSAGVTHMKPKPEPGTAGKPFAAAANYIRIQVPDHAIWQYHVSYDPPIDNRRLCIRLLYEHSEVIGRVRAFDGAILYLPKDLGNKVTTFKSIRRSDEREITVKVQQTRTLESKDCVQLFNIIFRRVLKILDMKQVGRHYYIPGRSVPIPQHKLEVWPGYIVAVQEYSGGLMLHTDASHKVLSNETVLEQMRELYRRNKNTFKEECTRHIVGTIVMTRYNNRTYRVDDIAWDKNPMSTFQYHNSEEMTFADYYRKTYEKEITDMGQPLLISRPKKSEQREQQKRGGGLEVICLIPELACTTGLSDDMRADFRVMKDLATHTRITPEKRHQVMLQYLDSIRSNPDALAELTNWGIRLDTDILPVNARQLPMEKIFAGNNVSFMAGPQADWGRDLGRARVLTPVNLNHWMVIATKRDSSKAQEFLNTMSKVCPQMGIKCEMPMTFELQDDKTQSYISLIRDRINPQLQLVIAIFPTSRDDRYSAFKKLCCVEAPVPSQAIIARTIGQPQKLRSVTQKIALQINCKLGGDLWHLDIPLKGLMTVGIDVFHDPSRSGRSIGAVIASMNKVMTRWYSRCCFQDPHQELIDGLKMCLTAALKKYHDVNHELPGKIIIFRDGVGDGQLAVVAEYEQAQFTSCFAQFGADYMPKLSIVVVQKRINTRIFGVLQGSRMDNPPPGVVVDHTITRRDWYDFFLVSQHVRQGTVSPTHYVSSHDTSTLKPDHMQRLAYKLTHMYYNWPGTVRVPAPCQYAHKLAYLVGQSLHKEPSLELSDRLFYL
ncbi:piwi-like protein 1 [Amphiura filiformis]|uniref:piwi-like protein 1 n=1 Tax=Amphiura filiformis TaxID=82378 RepID=UPI003B20D47C